MISSKRYKSRANWIAVVIGLCALACPTSAQPQPLPNTAPLQEDRDLAALMVKGIDQYLTKAIQTPRITQPDRARLRTIIGAVDERVPVELIRIADPIDPKPIAETPAYTVHAIRWTVLPGVHGEGLLLEPKSEPRASVVAIPDCDRTPETLTIGNDSRQFARRLAESGCRVIVPTLIDRGTEFSAFPGRGPTNVTHREFIYRGAYEMGRHLIGYEVQKVLAAIDWLTSQTEKPVGVIGYGDGGLIAFHAAAIDERIDAAVISGYFQPRQNLWREPIYRNVWSLLRDFGDAEIASLIHPRKLIIEAAAHPERTEPIPTDGRKNGAPGIITTPPFDVVQAEFQRAQTLAEDSSNWIELTGTGEDPPGSDDTLRAFLNSLNVPELLPPYLTQPQPENAERTRARMKRQFDELVEHTQRLMRESPNVRAEFWSKADPTSVESWKKTTEPYRDYFHEEVIGELPPPDVTANPRTRLVYDEPNYRGYEVVLDVYDTVIAYGILLVPKDLAEGERRPVVVCQHGLEGRPQDLADPDIHHDAYNQYGCKLAEEGFIVYAPQNPYIGQDSFRVLQRKANPLKLSLFSFIVRQHERTLEWLATLPFVDSDRIAFYGLSYGGKTAMRVPAILQGYCISICSGDFNEWIWKNVSATSPYSYLFTGEYEMFEFNLGNTYNYAEMSWLIFPRPFMVERGHQDGVAPDEWVAYEYAKTRRHYDALSLSDKTEIEYFNGPHTINGVGTFEFLRKHLKFPKK